jgi:UDP-N-acetylmuramate dehydrogenase
MTEILSEETINKIKNILKEDEIFPKEPMYKHTSFRIGGPAELFLTPEREEIRELLELLKGDNIPFVTFGNGSNVLVSDDGIAGVVISTMKMTNVMVDSDKSIITADAGCSLQRIATEAFMNSLTGMEFAAGIPGSLGGAIFMNAGAYGSEMKNIVLQVQYIDESGEIRTIGKDNLDFGYRHSYFSSCPGKIIIGATIQLNQGDKDTIIAYQTELLRKRKEKQPIEYPSAGSTFKRPEGYYAGKLIQDAGLMGYRVGDAQVSLKHAGFVVNLGDASAADVLNLIKHVQDTVYEKFQVRLEPEVRIIGSDIA